MHRNDVGVLGLHVAEQAKQGAAPRRVKLLHAIKASEAFEQRSGALELDLGAMRYRAPQPLGLQHGLLRIGVQLLHRLEGDEPRQRQRCHENETGELQSQ